MSNKSLAGMLAGALLLLGACDEMDPGYRDTAEPTAGGPGYCAQMFGGMSSASCPSGSSDGGSDYHVSWADRVIVHLSGTVKEQKETVSYRLNGPLKEPFARVLIDVKPVDERGYCYSSPRAETSFRGRYEAVIECWANLAFEPGWERILTVTPKPPVVIEDYQQVNYEAAERRITVRLDAPPSQDQHRYEVDFEEEVNFVLRRAS